MLMRIGGGPTSNAAVIPLASFVFPYITRRLLTQIIYHASRFVHQNLRLSLGGLDLFLPKAPILDLP